ncbi:MAG: alpha/beta hydrolase [Pseudomonadota bacterium]
MPEVIFNGSDGRLEGRYVHGTGPNPPLAIVLHPHPLHGGTMNNRIVYTMFQAFQRRGFSVLRFNFRGVGRSQGVFDHGQGELRDAASALDWMQLQNPNSRIVWCAGYSFGAWIAMQLLMRRPEIHRFVCAALPASLYDFSFLAPCPSSGLVIHGDKDIVTATDAVIKLTDKLQHQRAIDIQVDVIEGGDHVFAKKMDAFTASLEAYLDENTAGTETPESVA